MSEEPAEPDDLEAAAADPGRALLAALLRLPPERATEIRARTPGRRRPRPQSGPSADYGADGS